MDENEINTTISCVRFGDLDAMMRIHDALTRARRVEAEQAEQLRQKDEALKEAYVSPELLAWRAESPHGFSRVYAADSAQAKERGAIAQRCRTEEITVSRWPDEDLCKASQKDKSIRALVDLLEAVFRRGLAADDVYGQVRIVLVLHGRLP